MNRNLLALGFCLAVHPAAAQMESMELAVELGTVLGSERICDLKYDQGAIQTWIEANAPADDMGFASTLSMMSQGIEMQNANLSPSRKTAHCAAVTKTARHFGFIK